MTLTKDITAKFAVAAVAVAMIFSAYAPAASAQTDLQAQITALLAQIQQLEAQLGGTTTGATSASAVCPYTWTRDLTMGSEGADVMKLQQFLNANADTRVAVTGAGSAGMETMFFGPATAAAVSKMQVMYRAEVLTPGGLVNPTGYFGSMSRAKANSLCTTAPVVDTDEDGDDSSDMTLGGEASLDSFEIDSAFDDEIEEGSSDQEVAELTVEFEDGDAEISRLDVKFVGTNSGAEAADAFETISLWVDGDMVAEKNADDEDDYQSDEQTMRFSGLDIVAMEDEELEIVVAVSTQNNLDTAEKGTWTVSVTSMRFFDADGVATTDIGTGDLPSGTETFSIEEAGFEDEVIVKTSSNDPDSATLQVENNSKSDWYNVFAFDLDTDDSVNDIELNNVFVTVEFSSSTFAALVDDAELTIDGVTIDDYTVAAGLGGATTSILNFDVDGDVVVDAGDRVEAELMLRFKSLNSGDEGTTVRALVTTANTDAIKAEGTEDIGTAKLAGSATGDYHTLRTSGVNVSKESTSAVITTQDGNTNDYATYEIEIEVTAFEQDVFISTNAATSTQFSLRDGAGNAVTVGTSTSVLTSSADENNGYFEINEGGSETFTLTVTYVPGAANTQARLRMDSVSFAATAATPNQVQATLPVTAYRTAVVTIVN